MKSFKIGNPVWVYDAPCAPREGVVSQVLDYGVRVEIDDRLERNRVRSTTQVFHRPSDHSALLSKIEEDAYQLQRIAGNFAQVCPNCNGAGEIQTGHPDDARPCDCATISIDLPY